MNKTLNELLSGRDNNFDFIRFCAALSVILSHSYPINGVNALEPVKLFSGGLTTIGGIAVSIFFVISGMLIAQSFDRTKEFFNFVEARVLRIYPALIATILVTVFVIGPLFTTVHLREYFTSLSTLKYLSNVAALRIQFTLPGVFTNNPYPGAVNGSLWTLPLEIACYGLVAAALSLRKKRFVQSITLVILVILVFNKTLFNINVLYFTIGTVMYLLRNYIRITTPIAILSAIGYICALTIQMNQVIAFTLLGLSIAYITLYLGFIKTGYFKHFAKFGDFSYGMYVWAFPIQQVIVLTLPHLTIIEHFSLSALCTFIVSIGSWHLVEKQGLKLKKRFKIDKYFHSSRLQNPETY
jgi:peptidoglycan/LPS O-acetylase OafA/YrhL